MNLCIFFEIQAAQINEDGVKTSNFTPNSTDFSSNFR